MSKTFSAVLAVSRGLLGTLAPTAMFLAPAAYAQDQVLMVGAHRTVYVAASSKEAALKAGLEQVVKGIVTEESENVENEILGSASRYADVVSGPNDAGKYGVKVYLVQPPAGKIALLHKLKSLDLLPQLKIGVVVPEQHRFQAVPIRVPDPAGETAIARGLEQSGFRGMDPDTVAKIRDDAAIRAISTGNVSDQQLRELKNRTGMDILIVGEAFSTETNRPITADQLMTVEGQVEVKAINLGTGERFASERRRGYGRGLAGEQAGKLALEAAGKDVFKFILDPILLHSVAGGVRAEALVQLELRGLGSASNKNAFLKIIKEIPGVTKVVDPEFTGGVLFIEIRIDRKALEEFTATLEENSKLKKFRIKVTDDKIGAQGGKVLAIAKPRASDDE